MWAAACPGGHGAGISTRATHVRISSCARSTDPLYCGYFPQLTWPIIWSPAKPPGCRAPALSLGLSHFAYYGIDGPWCSAERACGYCGRLVAAGFTCEVFRQPLDRLSAFKPLHYPAPQLTHSRTHKLLHFSLFPLAPPAPEVLNSGNTKLNAARGQSLVARRPRRDPEFALCPH